MAALAQHDHSSHKQGTTTSRADTSTKATVVDANTKQQFSQLLTSYLNMKNALVTGDANSASTNADQFLRTVNTIDFKVISEGNVHILANDAGKISAAKDLKKQREYFVTLSFNVASVAKAFKLSDKPIYVQYCPMKKASWLSSEKQIRNPYYGSSMLTCGEVTETL
jgi:DNA-binding transcriptional regulator WhiA